MTIDAASIIARGFTPRNLSAFELMLQRPGKGRYVLAGTEAPDIGVVDIDGADGQSVWQKFRHDYPDLPAIIMSVSDPGTEDAAFIQKPVRVDELLKTLRIVLEDGGISSLKKPGLKKTVSTQPAPSTPNKVEVRVESNAPRKQQPPQAAGNLHLSVPKPISEPEPLAQTEPPAPKPEKPANDIAFDDKRPAYAASLSFSEDYIERVCGKDEDTSLDNLATLESRRWFLANTLLQLSSKAWEISAKYRIPVEIDSGFSEIYVLPNGHILTSISDNTLRSYCVMQLDPRVVELRKKRVLDIKEIIKSDPAGYQSTPVESFFWKLALWTARGRIPEGLDLGRSVSISRWPNLTRNLATPYAMPIASLLYQYASTIPALCRELGIPQRYVFSFISAADTIGILEQDGGADLRSKDQKPQSKARKSLFQHILGRIGYS